MKKSRQHEGKVIARKWHDRKTKVWAKASLFCHELERIIKYWKAQMLTFVSFFYALHRIHYQFRYCLRFHRYHHQQQHHHHHHRNRCCRWFFQFRFSILCIETCANTPTTATEKNCTKNWKKNKKYKMKCVCYIYNINCHWEVQYTRILLRVFFVILLLYTQLLIGLVLGCSHTFTLSLSLSFHVVFIAIRKCSYTRCYYYYYYFRYSREFLSLIIAVIVDVFV